MIVTRMYSSQYSAFEVANMMDAAGLRVFSVTPPVADGDTQHVRKRGGWAIPPAMWIVWAAGDDSAFARFEEAENAASEKEDAALQEGES